MNQNNHVKLIKGTLNGIYEIIQAMFKREQILQSFYKKVLLQSFHYQVNQQKDNGWEISKKEKESMYKQIE